MLGDMGDFLIYIPENVSLAFQLDIRAEKRGVCGGHRQMHRKKLFLLEISRVRVSMFFYRIVYQ